MTRKIKVLELWKDQAIAGSGVLTSKGIDLTHRALNGNMSIQYTLVGAAAPTITITYKVSNDGETYVTPATGGDLGTDLAAGTDLIDISSSIEFAKYIQIIVTETATNAATAFELFLAFQ